MLDIIWDIFQQKQINELKQDRLEQSKIQEFENGIASKRLAELEKRHEQLKLITLAMWSLLRDHTGMLESDLRKYIKDIDLLDGKEDGKVSHKKERLECTNCSNFFFSTSICCPYCGLEPKRKDPFQKA